jgi:bifunctional NMN adenylyltransferase/nudix hydrolase
MSKKYDTLVFIGRFQPTHNGHIHVLKKAFELAKQVIIIVGSSNLPRTYKNPFTFEERRDMLVMAVNRLAPNPRDVSVRIESNFDTMYDDTSWILRVQKIVEKHTLGQTKIGIIGHYKDRSSSYLDMFPTWDKVETDMVEPLHATNIRELFFKDNHNMNYLSGVVPQSTLDYLNNFKRTTYFETVVKERQFIETYKKQYDHLAYPPVFVTADAVVIQSGYMLLIKRRAEPGKGLWALPGGFLNANTDKSIEEAMLRELKEETGLKVPEKVLKGSIRYSKVFDAIDRSARGRTITHAFKIVLDDGEWNLPKIKAGDDAETAKWVLINNITSDMMFEDHYDIIMNFLGKWK